MFSRVTPGSESDDQPVLPRLRTDRARSIDRARARETLAAGEKATPASYLGLMCAERFAQRGSRPNVPDVRGPGR
jgi:hypothetical protein